MNVGCLGPFDSEGLIHAVFLVTAGHLDVLYTGKPHRDHDIAKRLGGRAADWAELPDDVPVLVQTLAPPSECAGLCLAAVTLGIKGHAVHLFEGERYHGVLCVGAT